MRHILIAAALFSATPAAACSCWWGISDVFPADGDVDVPVNARVVVEFYGDDELTWALVDGQTGEPVPATVTLKTEEDRVHRIYTPDALLAPNHTYQIALVNDEGGGLDEATVHSRFTTGSATDDDAPDVPTFTASDVSSDRRSNSSCGDSASNTWEFEGTEAALIFELEVSTTEDFSASRTLLSHGTAASAGWGGCLASWPELEFGERLFGRVRAIDAAGNTSAWSEPLRPTGGVASGCSTTGSGPSPVWLLGLALLGRRRRA